MKRISTQVVHVCSYRDPQDSYVRGGEFGGSFSASVDDSRKGLVLFKLLAPIILSFKLESGQGTAIYNTQRVMRQFGYNQVRSL